MVMSEQDRLRCIAESKKTYYERNKAWLLPKMAENTKIWRERQRAKRENSSEQKNAGADIVK
jgi:hypothetical protein